MLEQDMVCCGRLACFRENLSLMPDHSMEESEEEESEDEREEEDALERVTVVWWSDISSS
jgi:hypothetical protein